MPVNTPRTTQFAIWTQSSVTPTDGAQDLTETGPNGSVPTGLYVGVSGDVKITDPHGNVSTMVGLAAGVWHRIAFTKVHSTGTTATNILAGWV